MNGREKKSDYPTLADYYLAAAASCEAEAARLKERGDHAGEDHFKDLAERSMEHALELA